MPRAASSLKINETSVVQELRGEYNTGRLLELGFRPGAEIRLARKSLLGDTMFFCLGEKHFALRKEEAASILIED